MLNRGRINKGSVALEWPCTLPEGVYAVARPVQSDTQHDPSSESLSELLLRSAGTIKGLPRDMARNHDHYIHGTPKR